MKPVHRRNLLKSLEVEKIFLDIVERGGGGRGGGKGEGIDRKPLKGLGGEVGFVQSVSG